MKQDIIGYIKNMVISLFCTIGLIGISGQSITEINGISGVLFIFMMCNLYFYHKKCKDYVQEDGKLAVLTSVMIALCLAGGFVLRDADSSGQIAGWGSALLMKVMLFGFGTGIFLYYFLQNVISYGKQSKVVSCSEVVMVQKLRQSPRKTYWVLTVLMVICWLPYFLTFYPGIFGSDPLESLRQVLGMEAWTNHHPILYTGYMKLFVMLFQGICGVNGALALMTLCQMCLLAGMLSYAVVWLMKKDAPLLAVLFGILFTALNPVIGVFSVYATKDVLFGGVVILYVLHLFDLARTPEVLFQDRKFLIQLFVISFFVLFLRNNGVFLVIGTFAVAFFVYKPYWKKIGLGLMGICLCLVIQKQIIFPVLGVVNGSFAESLSIPLQQIGQAMADGAVLNKGQEKYLNELLPIEKWGEVYQAGYTDMIKFDEAFDDAYLNAHKGEFIKVWAGMLPHNFGSFVKGYLLQTVGYWDMQQTESLSAYGVVENDLGVEQLDCIRYVTGMSLQPLMEKLILVCRKLPVLSYLTNMAVMVWLLGFAVFYTLTHKKKELLAFLPLILVWGTIMIAAPAAVKFRYLFANYLAWPIMLSWIRISIKE